MNASGKTSSLFIHSRDYDLGFFILSGLAALLLIIPFVMYGQASVWPIYNIYLVFFGLPHNYMTWATLLPPSSRKTFRMEPIITAGIFSLALCALIPFTKGTSFGDWILSFIAYFSLWHAYRQHHGICKVYDSVQAKRTGDTTIFADRKPLNLFFGFAAMAVIVWAFTHPHIDYLLSPDDKHELIHPVVPWEVFIAYCTFTVLVGLYGLKRAVWDRYRAGKFIPWPQLGLMGVALAAYIVPYFFMGLESIPVPVAIGTIFHNIQYFGFVWAFERQRVREFQASKEILGFPQRLVAQASWKTYGAVALAYSFMIVAFYLTLPHVYGLALIYFTGISHYIIDGYVWRRDTNQLISKVVERWAVRLA